VVNPAQSAYTAWTGLFTISMVLDVVTSLKLHSTPRTRPLLIELSLALAPLIPLVGFHVNQARRLFRAGFTLGDLRAAIALGDRERAEGAPAVEGEISWSDRALRIGTYLSFATALSTMFFVRLGGHPGPLRMTAIMLPWISSLVLAAAANVNDVPMLPRGVRGLFTTSLRDRLWKSRVGEWFAKRLNAPTVSRPVGGGIFRATEILLGDAAADLFAALPETYRRQLGDLPATVASLEARAAEARAEAERLSELSARAAGSDSSLVARHDAAKSQLATTVAALEGIRLDLLRLHAGASDLAPLTTLLDAARQMAVEINELADAQLEVQERLGGGAPAREVTPA
jgi:serine/threonine-protein kinase